MEALECGAASLCMILAYYKRWVSLPEMRTTLGVSRDGVTMKSILNGARAYGLEAKAMMMKASRLPEIGSFPCIAYWDNNHFVVITGYTDKHVFINNPAAGPEKYTWEEFTKHYSKKVMFFSPGETFEPGGKPASIIEFASKRLHGTKAVITFMVLAGLIAAVLGVVSPQVSQVFVDKVLGDGSNALLLPLLVILVVSAVVTLVLNLAQATYLNSVRARFDLEANASFMQKLLHVPMRFYSQRTAGDLLSRQSSNAGIAETLMNTIAPLFVNMVSLVVYVAIMLKISVPLTIIGVGTTLINLGVAYYISKKRVEIFRVIARDSGSLSGVTSGVLGIMETVKATGAEKSYFRMWTGEQSALVAGKARAARMNNYLGSIPTLLVNFANAAVIVLGVWLIMNGQMTAGSLIAMQSLISMFFKPAQSLISSSQTIQEMRTDMERVEDILDHEDDVVFTEAWEDPSFNRIAGNIELKHITFGYSTQLPPLIEDFSLSIKPGSRIALVGGSGSGKSTIAKLVAGLYQPWEGEILYEGLPSFAYHRAAFTGAIAVVDQDISVEPGTIMDNIKFGAPLASEEDVVQAAKDADIHEIILARENGYQNVIAEGGNNFSGGQRQQLEIARALAGNPSVLVMDEATSALDAQTENRVMDAVKKRGIAMIIIAHRLSTVRDSDEIIVLDQGHVVERGTHDELMDQQGSYFHLVSAY